MVLPLPPTLLPIHPCLAEPPPDAVKGVLIYRTVLKFLIGIHILLVIALLISPASHLAFSHSLSIFLGIMACHSTMPLRYNIYALVTLFVSISSIIRFADRVSLPEFGYSYTNRVLQLAQAIDAIVDVQAEETGSFPQIIVRHMSSKGPRSDYSKSDGTINVKQLLKILNAMDAEHSLGIPKADQSDEKSFLQSGGKSVGNNGRFIDEGVPNPTPPSDLNVLQSPGLVSSFLQAPQVQTEKKEASVADSFFQLPRPEVTGRQSIKWTKEQLEELVHFRPAIWRSTLEMVTFGIVSLVTTSAAVVSFTCGRKIEREINVSIARALGIDQETSSGPNESSSQPLLAPMAPPPEPYLHDSMGELATAYRPFGGQEVTLEGWLAQENAQQENAQQENARQENARQENARQENARQENGTVEDGRIGREEERNSQSVVERDDGTETFTKETKVDLENRK